MRVIASQKLPRDSEESIFAARHQDASQGPLGRGWQKRLAKGWRKVGEGLAKGWHGVGEGLAGFLAPSSFAIHEAPV